MDQFYLLTVSGTWEPKMSTHSKKNIHIHILQKKLFTEVEIIFVWIYACTHIYQM